MRQAVEQARLYLNDVHVGDVAVRGWESSWGFGDFAPNDEFTRFSLLFGRWSLLMHAADDERHLPQEASDELRKAEWEMDSLRAKLFLLKAKEWREVSQVNIDGGLIEWKEKWAGSRQ